MNDDLCIINKEKISLMKALRIHPVGSLPTNKAPEKNFTGEVYISDYFECAAPSRLVSATLTFTPGARTPWKVNPLGQTLIVTSGVGWAQCEGEEIFEIHAGDIVWFPSGRRHWDGATPNHAMTYIAIQEAKDGKAVEFSEKVTDGEYLKGTPIASSRRWRGREREWHFCRCSDLRVCFGISWFCNKVRIGYLVSDQKHKIMNANFSKFSDSQWQVIEKIIDAPRKRKHSLRTILNAIFWINNTGVQWRNLDSKYPPWQNRSSRTCHKRVHLGPKAVVG